MSFLRAIRDRVEQAVADGVVKPVLLDLLPDAVPDPSRAPLLGVEGAGHVLRRQFGPAGKQLAEIAAEVPPILDDEHNPVPPAKGVYIRVEGDNVCFVMVRAGILEQFDWPLGGVA